MRAQTAVLTEVIEAIGRDEFAQVTARALLEFVRFDLAAVVLHPRAAGPSVMFDNFDEVDARGGLDNYVSFTHAVNPILRRTAPGMRVVRAKDFAVRVDAVTSSVQPYLVRSDDEEMGFRTVGWPRHQEEIGLYVGACGGVVELSFYRERGRCAAPRALLESLQMLGAPIAAAFETQGAFAERASDDRAPSRQRAPTGHSLVSGSYWSASPAHVQLASQAASTACRRFAAADLAPRHEQSLSPREAQVAELMLAGCSSEAIALRLDISRYTVKDHRKRIFRKLGIASLAELFALHRRPSARS
jgi:DNA-binding CsgD family transcriptional regulator